MNWHSLLAGEVMMTVNILIGVLVGDLVFRLKLAEMAVGRFLPVLTTIGVGPILGTALAVGVGSSKVAAALLARGVEEGSVTRDGAIWGTISLSFPAYLRRWPSTLALCVGMAGTAGWIFAFTLLLRSFGRFLFVIVKARGSETDSTKTDHGGQVRSYSVSWYRRLLVTLPVAWTFYASAFLIMPEIERLLKESLGGSLLPVAGWGVASAALAGISASLALARGALANGDLDTAQTVFALLLGNGLGYFTRALRQNAGYFFGIFPADISRAILVRNIATMIPFVIASLVIPIPFIL
ncbi:MAG: hypothetical protein LBO21_04620 [Synergistaceae bacterium]|nr:hypothetical protein [Synergistaceae bacterium]